MTWRDPPEHETDHSEAHEGCRLAGVTLVVTREPPVPADPCKRPLHDPTLWQHDEAMPITAAHDLERPRACPGYGGLHLAALVPRITNDALDEGEGSSGFSQQGFCSVAILNAGRVDGHGQQQAQRIGQDVALAASDLLARIIA